ncbi:class I SAM-dependent methyltransferase [Streptomyces sp. S.PNR 29]|uniref:class I SAM-dependent methyltransferase n=1 Tax=Streptomyces sp. S.PNR 29 TaxID=2973805 RepID=UPI0025B0D062|nr:class I SAM-dependent methyltransferase [Streptomyces sp. S.PNR 29]MDN0197894.1 class I SAM-dependent methyltransferase [Streptomyces sp. S.PNR 29]
MTEAACGTICAPITTGEGIVAGEEHGRRAAAVFDALGPAYEKAFAHSEAHRASLQWLLGLLAPGSRVLDVGSGTGRPTASTLTEAGHEVLGIDVSPVMVELAARQVPAAEFRCADIRDVELEDGSFDAVCVYFSLLMMSRQEQSELVRRLVRALRPGGGLVLATVPADVEDVEFVFMGQPVRATSFATEDVVALVKGAGLAVVSDQSVLFTPAHSDAAPEPHLFLCCRRDARAPAG